MRRVKMHSRFRRKGKPQCDTSSRRSPSRFVCRVTRPASRSRKRIRPSRCAWSSPSRRGRCRPYRPRPCTQAVRTSGPASDCRQPCWRERQHRCRGRSEGARRRLHDLDGRAHLALDQPHLGTQGSPVRLGTGPEPRDDRGHGAVRVGGAPVRPGPVDAGVHRLCTGEAGALDLRILGGRRAAAAGGRNVQVENRHPHAPRTVQG